MFGAAGTARAFTMTPLRSELRTTLWPEGSTASYSNSVDDASVFSADRTEGGSDPHPLLSFRGIFMPWAPLPFPSLLPAFLL